MPLFQANSEQLQEIAVMFQMEAECVGKVLQDLAAKTDSLRGYGWIGLGAEAYFDEFDNHIQPTLKAVIAFLDAQSSDASKVAQQVDQAADRILASTRLP
jgi:WXG100 family type VII secretion target